MEKENCQKPETEVLKQMQKRRITLADGRYLIFYTFGDEEIDSTTKQSAHELNE